MLLKPETVFELCSIDSQAALVSDPKDVPRDQRFTHRRLDLSITGLYIRYNFILERP
jgi:hypothetical protein